MEKDPKVDSCDQNDKQDVSQTGVHKQRIIIISLNLFDKLHI